MALDFCSTFFLFTHAKGLPRKNLESLDFIAFLNNQL